MNVIKTTDKIYTEPLKKLYTEAFGQGESAQFIDTEWLHDYINDVFRHGYFLIALQHNRPCGSLWAFPFIHHTDLSADSLSCKLNVEKTLYLAELMVTVDVRGRGVAQLLMDVFERSAIDSGFTDGIVRVWDENQVACRLYQQNGYNAVASMLHHKISIDGKTHFCMNKIYLHKTLTIK